MSNDILSSLILFGVLILLFWFLFISPQKKELQKRTAMLNAIKVGDKIETISRVIAEVVAIEDDKTLLINIAASGMCKIRIDREGVARVIKSEAATTTEDDSAKDKKSDKNKDA